MSNKMRKISTYTLLFLVLLLSFTRLSAEDRASGYAVYGPITINTVVDPYSAYRLYPVLQIPNPNPVQVPKGGYGFAWYRVEGKVNNEWKPVLAGTVGYSVICGMTSAAKISTIGRVKYPNADEEYWVEPGMVAIKLSSYDIGNGDIGNTASVHITTVNEVPLSNPISIQFAVTNMNRSVEWYYQYKIRPGAGLTLGAVSVEGKFEKGSGATIRVNLSDTNLTDWNSLTISRNLDYIGGVKPKVGPPQLGVLNVGFSRSLECGASNADEYTFTKQELENGKALYCGYLFLEPFLSLRMTKAKTVRFTNALGEAVIRYCQQNGYNLESNRIAEESELMVRSNTELSAGISFDPNFLPKNLSISLGANIGIGGRAGTKLKHFTNGNETRSVYVEGKAANEFGFGLKQIQTLKNDNTFTRKFGLLTGNYDSEFSFELQNRTRNGIDSYRFVNTYSVDTSVNMIDFGVPLLDNLEITNWTDINNSLTIGIMNDSSSLAQKVSNIGVVSNMIALNNTIFSDGISSTLDGIKVLHDHGINAPVGYGSDLIGSRDFAYDVDIPFPVGVTPFYLNIGGGISFGRRIEAPLQRGYWYGGLPYLSFQGKSYERANVHFAQVMSYIWDKVKYGTNWSVFCPILARAIAKRLIPPFWGRGEYTVNLNDFGSYLKLKDTSLPDTLAEAYCEFWTWQEEVEDTSLSWEGKKELTRFNRELRQYREEIAGMHYGIGGFYELTPESVAFADTALISISYSDADVADLDESSLAVYWEGDDGTWHHIPSTVYPESNRVEAYITEFRTYTLAPRLPQGSLNMTIQPDSLAADGVSIASVSVSGLYNNDGSPVSEGSSYTVTISRGSIVTPDIDPIKSGHQVEIVGDTIEFQIQSDTIAMPIELGISSDIGYANGQATIPLYNVNPPQTPVLLSLEPEHRAIRVTWETVDETSIAGYKIHYNTNSSGAPYDGTSNVNGENSPVAVGLTDSHVITGLNNSDNYYIAVTAVDVSGRESLYSNEMQIQPTLRAVQDVSIEPVAAGIRLTWQPSFGAGNYKIYRADSPDAPIDEMTLIGQTSSLFWIDTSDQSNNRGFYVVVAVGY